MNTRHSFALTSFDPKPDWTPSYPFIRFTIGTILVICAAHLLAVQILLPDQLWRTYMTFLLALVAVSSGLLLARGHGHAAVLTLVMGAWVYCGISSWVLGGTSSPTIIIYPLILLLLGWVSNLAWTALVAAMTLALTLFLVLAQTRGWLPQAPPTHPLMRWLVDAGIMVLTVALILRVTRAFRSQLDEHRLLSQDFARAQAVAHVGSWVYELQTDRLQLSDETCRIFGLPLGTVGSHDSYLSRVHADDRAGLDAEWKRCLAAGRSFVHEHRIVRRDQIRWVRQVAEFEVDGNSRPLRSFGTTQDISERQQQQAEVLAARHQLEGLLGALPDLLFEMDLQGVHHACRTTRPELLYAPAEQVIGRSVSDVLPAPAAQACLDALQEAARDGVSYGRQFSLPLPDGLRWFELSVSREPVLQGQSERFVMLSRDITERKRAAEALRQSEVRMQAVFQASPIAIVVSRITDGVFLDLNDAALTMFGYRRQEVIGHSVHELGVYEVAAQRDAMFRQLQAQQAVDRFPVTFRRKDGSTGALEMSGRVAELDGQACLVSTLTDVTELRRFEAKQAELESQLRESQKMEALGTLAGGIAHDFNNIVAAIIGNAELARQDLDARHPALQSLDEIRKASRRAKDLVQQILAFGRRQTPQRKLIELCAVVEESCQLLRASLPAGVGLNVSCDPATPRVLADAIQIEQVVLNLCNNAWYAVQGRTPAGQIQVRLEPRRLHGTLFAALSVHDNGQGMDEATRLRIFEPFFTTKPPGQGTGLGLSVVHGILKEHEASIEVSSTPGVGTDFLILFPVPAVQTLPDMPSPSAEPAGHGAGKHVLYLDDDEAIVLLMTRLLHRQGYRVSGFEDPHAALAAVRAAPGDFDLVVTDYNMPKMSGLDVARGVRELRSDLPVAMASGYITEEMRRQAPLCGVSQLIYKPNTVDELCAAITRLTGPGDA